MTSHHVRQRTRTTRGRHAVALAALGLALIGAGAITAATPAQAEGRLLRVVTSPPHLHFAGLQPGDRVEFLATIDPLTDDPITVVAHVEAAAGQLLFSAKDRHSTLDVATCPVSWQPSHSQPHHLECPEAGHTVLAPTILEAGHPLDFDLPNVEPHQPLELRIGMDVGDPDSTGAARATGAANFLLKATQVPTDQHQTEPVPRPAPSTATQMATAGSGTNPSADAGNSQHASDSDGTGAPRASTATGPGALPGNAIQSGPVPASGNRAQGAGAGLAQGGKLPGGLAPSGLSSDPRLAAALLVSGALLTALAARGRSRDEEEAR